MNIKNHLILWNKNNIIECAQPNELHSRIWVGNAIKICQNSLYNGMCGWKTNSLNAFSGRWQRTRALGEHPTNIFVSEYANGINPTELPEFDIIHCHILPISVILFMCSITNARIYMHYKLLWSTVFWLLLLLFLGRQQPINIWHASSRHYSVLAFYYSGRCERINAINCIYLWSPMSNIAR